MTCRTRHGKRRAVMHFFFLVNQETRFAFIIKRDNLSKDQFTFCETWPFQLMLVCESSI